MGSDILIFWHHVGREHGGLKYTKDIRKNSEEVINEYMKLKEMRWVGEQHPNRFYKFNEQTLVELPPNQSDKDFIIVYFIDEGLQFEYKYDKDKQQHLWVIDIVNIKEIKDGVYRVSDYFIDINIYFDGSYQVLDLDEFKEAFERDIITSKEVIQALHSFHLIVNKLNENNFPDSRLNTVFKHYYKKK